jgi:hypothetical protein
MTWNKALDTGGVVVSDEVKLEINAELAERAAAPPVAAPTEKPAAAGTKAPTPAPAKPNK